MPGPWYSTGRAGSNILALSGGAAGVAAGVRLGWGGGEMVWVVGERGMLGSEFRRLLEAEGMAFVGSDREVDILDPAALEAFAGAAGAGAVAGGTAGGAAAGAVAAVAGTAGGAGSGAAAGAAGGGISWIVNCAAYTAVDRAEDEAELCRRLNVEGPANLAALAEKIGASILHISTDYVFDGVADRPYREDDPMGPTGVYGRTKAEGEVALAALCRRSVILRTAWLYGKDGPNFVYTMLRLMRQKDSIGVVADQRGSPTWARDLAAAMLAIVRSAEPRYGVFHFTDGGETNWYEFACEILRLGREAGLLEKDCRVEALTTEQYPTKARRPAYSVLSKDKIAAVYGVRVPEWRESLSRFFGEGYRFVDDMRGLASMAIYDLDTSRAMLAATRYLYVVFAMQQALEKNLKVLCLLHGDIERHHNLGRLADRAGVPVSAGERRLLDLLAEYFSKGRYTGDLQRLSEPSQREWAERVFFEGELLCEKIRRHPLFSTL